MRPTTDSGLNGNGGAHRDESPRLRRCSVSKSNPPETLATQSEEGFTLEELAGEMRRLGGNGDGGAKPDFVKKTAKSQTWIIAVLVTLFGAGGPAASWYALKGLAERNSEQIERQIDRIEELENQVKETRSDVLGVKSDVGAIRVEQKDQEIDRLREENKRLRKRVPARHRNRR